MVAHRDKWIANGLATGPTNKERFETAVRKCYAAAKLAPPKVVVWVPSPMVLCFAAPTAAYLIARHRGELPDSAVRSAVDSAVDSAVGSAVGSAVRSAVRSAVDSAVRSAVDSEAGQSDDARGALRTIRQLYYNFIGGNQWPGWQSYVTFLLQECNLTLGDDLDDAASAYAATAEGYGWWWPHKDFVMVSELPLHIDRDARGRLHSGCTRLGPRRVRRCEEIVTIGSLFSGIGGLELGLERAGLGPVVWQCEIDPLCIRVLEKHWPEAERIGDAVLYPRRWPQVDTLCGGFPCQSVSSAGPKEGMHVGFRKSSLWRAFGYVLDVIHPRNVVVENVASGARLWLDHVVGDLLGRGYRARAFEIDTRELGLPCSRPRIFVVAHPDEDCEPARALDGEVAVLPQAAGDLRGWRHAPPERLRVDAGLSDGLDRV